MTEPFAFDTNILIYSVDPSDATKHRVANLIVTSGASRQRPVPLQCLTEFYRATTRKRILTPQAAEMVVNRVLQVNEVIAAAAVDLLPAMQLHRQHQFSFFDALLVATATRAGSTTFFSEDLHHGATYGPLTVRNPFLLSPADLATLLA